MRFESQGDLFQSSESFAIDARFAGTVRTALDAASWVELVPGWISKPEYVFDQLARGVPWQQHRRQLYGQYFLEPRLTATYRDFSEMPHPELRAAAAVLSAHYGVEYDSVWLNLYRGGRDSTGWHRDHFSCRRPECIVPVVTLGAARRFLIKPRRGGESISFRPGAGDLLVMGGRSQRDWFHSVPKTRAVSGMRISVNFQSSTQALR